MSFKSTRIVVAAGAAGLLFAATAAGRGEYADRLVTSVGADTCRILIDAVRAGTIDRDALLADVCSAVRDDPRFADESHRGMATDLLCSLTRQNGAGILVIDHPLQIETLLLLSGDAHASVRVNSLQRLRLCDGGAELDEKVEQRCLAAAKTDDSAMARNSAASSLSARVDRVDSAAWARWRDEFLRLAADPVGDQVEEYARIEAVDPLRSMRDWQISFRAAFLCSLAQREGCLATLAEAELYDVRGRIAALLGFAGAFVRDLGPEPARQGAADLAAFVEWLARACSWTDVPCFPPEDGGLDEEGRPIEVSVEEQEVESPIDTTLIAAVDVLVYVTNGPLADDALRARIAEVAAKVGDIGTERVRRRAVELSEWFAKAAKRSER